tara:strand:+ start:369 stop:611 length:243 start_codon:yes stop_codon:yes gene_type:complete
MRISLYKKLKDEYKQELIQNIEEYPNMTADLIKELSRATYWSDLKLGTATSLITFTSVGFDTMTSTDWISGEIFINELED